MCDGIGALILYRHLHQTLTLTAEGPRRASVFAALADQRRGVEQVLLALSVAERSPSSGHLLDHRRSQPKRIRPYLSMDGWYTAPFGPQVYKYDLLSKEPVASLPRLVPQSPSFGRLLPRILCLTIHG